MFLYSDFDSILEKVNQQGREYVREVAEAVVMELKMYIGDNLYNKYEDSPFYDRTYEFMDSVNYELISDTARSSYRFKIYFDTDKMRSQKGENGKWNQHMNMYGQSVSDLIPTFIDKGVDTPQFSREGIDFTGEIRRLLREYGLKTNKLRRKFIYDQTKREQHPDYVGKPTPDIVEIFTDVGFTVSLK